MGAYACGHVQWIEAAVVVAAALGQGYGHGYRHDYGVGLFVGFCLNIAAAAVCCSYSHLYYWLFSACAQRLLEQLPHGQDHQNQALG